MEKSHYEKIKYHIKIYVFGPENVREPIATSLSPPPDPPFAPGPNLSSPTRTGTPTPTRLYRTSQGKRKNRRFTSLLLYRMSVDVLPRPILAEVVLLFV